MPRNLLSCLHLTLICAWPSAAFASSNVLQGLSDIGLTPAVAAAAGLSPAVVTGLVSVAEANAGMCDALAALRDQEVAACTQHAELLAQLREDPSNSDTEGQFIASTAAVESIRQQIAQTRSALRVELNATLAPQQVVVLDLVMTNRVRSLPLEFLRLSSMEEAGWADLEAAFVAESRAIRLGVTVEPEISQLLAEYRALPEVVSAKVGIEANLQPITEVWPT